MKHYDAIIIGGGLGGLTSGVMLSKEGLNVCVLEQHSVIGGCLQSFQRNGRVFDTGMHYVGSLSEGQIMHQYFKYLGIIDKLRLQKLDENGFDHFHFPDGTTYCHAMGYDNFI
jgi:all-trans-retinol 13,14-reductase